MAASSTRAATYVRVSTEEQVGGTSLGVQQSPVAADRAARLGAGRRLSDEGVSSALGAGLVSTSSSGVSTREIEVVVVARLDFRRSLRHLSVTLGPPHSVCGLERICAIAPD